MAAKPAKIPRPTPGPGDTNTPPQVAQVNDATQAALSGNPDEATPASAAAPQSVPESSPQGQGAAPEAGADETLPPLSSVNAKDLSDHQPDPTTAGSALWGPSNKPDEPITTGTRPVSDNPPRVDSATYAAVKAAASDPSAPQEIRNLFNLLNYHMTQG